MSLSINTNNSSNISTLLSSLSTDDTTSSLLTDYASIKNGSYAKLVKAYYASKSATTSEETETEKKNLTSAATAAKEFKSAADTLSSLAKSGTADSDTITEALKNFADTYNSLISAVDTADNSSLTKVAENLVNETASNLSLLNDVGISISSSTGKMSVDETVAASASSSTLKSLFATSGSYGDVAASKASIISSRAASASSGLYTSSGTNADSTYLGELYDSYN